MSDISNRTTALVVTWETDEAGDRWPVHRYGDTVIRCYETWVWRGVEFLADSTHNPLAPPMMTRSATIVGFEAFDSLSVDDGFTAACEYAELLPGTLTGLEVDDTGLMYAEVWTGTIDVWHPECDLRYSGPAASLRDKWHVALEQLPTEFRTGWHFSPRLQMLGRVGHVSEMQRKDPTVTPDADVWGNFIDGLDLE